MTHQAVAREEERSTVRGTSLFPHHLAIVEEAANMLGLRGAHTFSPAVQFIIEDWARLSRLEQGLGPSTK